MAGGPIFKTQEQTYQPQLLTPGPWEEIHSDLFVAKDRLVSIGVNGATGYLRTTTLPKLTDGKVRMWLSILMTKLEAKWKETKDLNDAIKILDDAIAHAGKKAGLIKDEPEKKEKKDEKNEKKEKKKDDAFTREAGIFASDYATRLRHIPTGSTAFNCVTLPIDILESMGGNFSKFEGGLKDIRNGGRLLSLYSSEKYGSNPISLLTWEEMKNGVESGTIKNGSLIMRLDPISKVDDLSPYINDDDYAITSDGRLVSPEKGGKIYLCRHYISVAYDGSEPRIVHASGTKKSGWKVKDQTITEFGDSFSLNTSSDTRYVVVDLAKLFPELNR